MVTSLLGTAIKDVPEDLKKLQHYFNKVVRERAETACGRTTTRRGNTLL